MPTYHSTKQNVSVCVNEDISTYIPNSSIIDFNKVSIDYSGVELLTSKNKIGEVIGSAGIYYDGKYLGDVDVVVGEEVKFSILNWSKDNPTFIIIFEIVIILLLAYILKKKNSILKKKQVFNRF